LLSGLCCFTSCNTPNQEEKKQLNNQPIYSLMVSLKENTANNWGYIILKKEKQFIRQFTIPAVEGNIPFDTQDAASLVGNLVVNKLNHSQPPSVSKKELDSLGIIRSNHDQQNKHNTNW
jgi:hypothetical protein